MRSGSARSTLSMMQRRTTKYQYFLNLTNVSWQLGLGSALCYKFRSEQEARGRMEVSYVSLKTLYSVLDTFTFPLVSSSVSCVCDCPGGPPHCQAGKDNC